MSARGNNKLQLAGKKIGQLTVLRLAGRTKSQNTLWECQCDCGKKTLVRGASLTKPHPTKSCGCATVNTTIARNQQYYAEHIEPRKTAPRKCRGCSIDKPPADFYTLNSLQCKSCQGAKNERNRLRTRYGLTAADVSEMRERQEDKCAICRAPLSRPHIDHCHQTGRVRGLLCQPCNHMLGNACDNTETLQAGIHYLRENGANPSFSLTLRP